VIKNLKDEDFKPLLVYPEGNTLVQQIIQNIAYNSKIVIDDLLQKLNIPEAEEDGTYPRALDCKKVFKAKIKS